MLFYRYLHAHYKSILFAILIIFLSLFPFENNSKQHFLDFPHVDKVVHFLLYASLTFIIFIERPGKMNAQNYLYIVLICLFLGGLIEFIQALHPHRSGDLLDMLANFTGSLFAIPVYYIFRKIK